MLKKIPQKQHLRQKKFFNRDLRLYKDYTENLNSWRLAYIERIKKDLLGNRHKGKALIDIGAGSGYVAVEMAKLGLKVFACDISSTAIKNLRNFKKNFSLTNFNVLHCSAEKIDLPDKSVDYVVANAILEHIYNEEETINEWKRILKPGGGMFIVVPLKYRYVWPFFWPINFINDKMVGHLRRYDLSSLKKKFELRVKKVYYSGHLLKMVWLLLSRTLFLNYQKNFKLDEYFDEQDRRQRHQRYGASNITVIFSKNASYDY